MTKKQRKRYGKLLGVILLMGLLKMLSGCCAHKTAMDGTETGVRHNNTDLSAPKVIESQDITKFCCDHSAAGAVDGLPPELEGSILVEYASGERIDAYDNSEMPYPCEIIEPLCALFERLADEAASLS